MSQTSFINPYSYMPPPAIRNNSGQTDSFLAYMQDGKIFRQTPEGPQAIGVTTKTHEDLQSSYDDLYNTTQEYYDALVKAGIITPEPTQEELLKRQSEQLKEQAEQLANASRVIAESAESQKALKDMILDLRHEIASLKNSKDLTPQGEDFELPANNIEQPSIVASVERTNPASVGNNTGLSELPKRADAGNVGTQHKYAAAPKGTGVSAKRASRRNT